VIKNRVIKQDWVDLDSLEWIQGNLKEISKRNFKKLITSIIQNDIIKCFHVWERPGGGLWCLDGNHLKKALEAIRESGTPIPQRVKADFIDCRDEKHAKELVLVYSASYAQIIEEGLYEFIETENLEFKSIREQIRLADVDLAKFQAGYYDEIQINEKEVDENIETDYECPRCGYRWS
jgi:hypothetical protein